MGTNRTLLVVLAASLWVAGCEYATSPASKGGLGESCLARNDCQAGLSCIGNVCVDSEVPIDVADKQCDLVECTKRSDCCDSEDECRCVDNACEDIFGCTDDVDCFSFGLSNCVSGECVQCTDDTDCGFDGTCVDSRCVECDTDADCDGDESCIANFCESGCTRDEECGPLQKCEEAECVRKDCESDRECVAFLDNPRATCGDDGDCTVECEADAECNATGFAFSKCQDGACTFLGCETNAECRAYFGEAGAGLLALCRGEDGEE